MSFLGELFLISLPDEDDRYASHNVLQVADRHCKKCGQRRHLRSYLRDCLICFGCGGETGKPGHSQDDSEEEGSNEANTDDLEDSQDDSEEEESKEANTDDLEAELASLSIKLEEENEDFRQKKEDHDVTVAKMKVKINQIQMRKERLEKEKMMRKKCNRPDCDNMGLHRCKRCKTVSVEIWGSCDCEASIR